MHDVRLDVWSYAREYEALREKILESVDAVFKSGRLILGAQVSKLEQIMADYVGVQGGVGVNSGTDALFLSLKAAGVGPGDEVITVPNTAVPTVSAIVSAGARPVFVDVNADDYLMDISQVEQAITSKTKALLPVHLYGQCADMDPLMEIANGRGLFVLEDCAQSQGCLYKERQAGSIGHAGAFSFYPTKILGAYGDGGWIGSNDSQFTNLARSLRRYGMEDVYYAERHGYNSRLDEVQAAILALKVPLLEGWIERRREIAALYSAALQPLGFGVPRENEHNRHVYYVYVAEHVDREAILAALKERGIHCNISYPYPIHTMRAYAGLGHREGEFPVTEAKAKVIFSLPMYPYLADEEVEYVIETMRSVMDG
jgi:dTDP-3-amino-2,3,6-trideoxy-4-keto-D-glucose/dTDP-3-amino-3,4,6-trideoxy-alpha-D-glucose/dTDP-2,6-dideoxy-D-kanosamine transaminase